MLHVTYQEVVIYHVALKLLLDNLLPGLTCPLQQSKLIQSMTIHSPSATARASRYMYNEKTFTLPLQPGQCEQTNISNGMKTCSTPSKTGISLAFMMTQFCGFSGYFLLHKQHPHQMMKQSLYDLLPS